MIAKAGALVAASKVQNFVVKGWGIDGVWFCLEFTGHVSANDVAAAKADFRSITPSNGTNLRVADVQSCVAQPHQ